MIKRNTFHKMMNRYQDIDMECPYCRREVTIVLNSRPTRQNSQIWRRRQCLNCKAIYTTHERVDLSNLIVIKKSGKTEMFSQGKLYAGIYRSTISQTKNRGKLVDKVTQEVEREILFLKTKRVFSEQIGNIVIRILKKHNTGAFLRFLAYCQDITNEIQLKRELARFLN